MGSRKSTRRNKKGGANEPNLPVLYVGLIPMPQGGYGPAPAYFALPERFKNYKAVAEYHSGLVYRVGDNGVAIGYPDEPIARWEQGMPPMGGKKVRRTNRRRTNRRRSSKGQRR